MLGKNDPMGRPCSGEVPKMSLGLAGGPLNVAERPKGACLSKAPHPARVEMLTGCPFQCATSHVLIRTKLGKGFLRGEAFLEVWM
jgi:hypothetical protein